MLKKITLSMPIILYVTTGLCSVFAMEEPQDQSSQINRTSSTQNIPMNVNIAEEYSETEIEEHSETESPNESTRKRKNDDDLNPALLKKQNIEKNTHEIERKKHEAVMDNPKATLSDRAAAQLELALMDRLGQATIDGKPDYPSARKGLKAVWDNSKATLTVRAAAQLNLARMDRLGHATPDGKPDYPSVRKGLEAVRDNPEATLSDRETAQLDLAVLDRLGKATPDGKPDLPSARKRLEAFEDNPLAGADNRALVRLNLADMDLRGHATPDGKPDLPSARKRLETSLKDLNVSDKCRMYAQETLVKVAQAEQKAQAQEKPNLQLDSSNSAMTITNRTFASQPNTPSIGTSSIGSSSFTPFVQPLFQPPTQSHVNYNPYGGNNWQYQNYVHNFDYQNQLQVNQQQSLIINQLQVNQQQSLIINQLSSKIREKDLIIQEQNIEIQKLKNNWALMEKVIQNNKGATG